ncbi:O-acetyltransferase OatA [Synechococcus sp. MIT S9509]|uniref:acyltransferase family protein n=1 Tax=Synechococcus sp. MIT S9509 TaxID=1801630 RepID=UPI0007BB3C36|nr:acyltransferase family protein [Synechococcus sp. MIT S9509]KZR91702.1 O-acetyltransferase OatA [Synechococcus sp. MIT S9509]
MTSRASDSKSTYQSKSSRYRPEIDGLRAFAVIVVIINHFNKDILPGGYLGVDIFFVISGYVITSSLLGRPSKDFKDFISGFYERRIKRLVPALSVFVLITSIAICLFDPSPDASLKTGLTSLFGLSNLYLLKQSTDYFAQSTEFNVFTHTWSLGVEEQFYVIFPFLIWFSGFGRQTKNGVRNLFLAVGVLTMTSLIGFLYLYPVNQPAAYFWMPTRFWEMAAGCLIFIVFHRHTSLEQFLAKFPPLLLVALMIGVMYRPMSMAASSTVVLVALSSILMASLKEGTAAFRIFTNSKVIYIGVISYSLYLWHWGVLSISRWTIGVHWWSVPIQVALMLGLAIASYRYIETPLRTGNWLGRRWKTLTLGGGVLVALSGGLFALKKPLRGQLFVGKETFEKSTPFIKGKQCQPRISELSSCYYVDNKSNETLWVLGDSHAGALYMAAEETASIQNMNLKLYTAQGTPFPPVGHYRKSKKQQDLQTLDDFRLIEDTLKRQLKSGDVVLLSMRLPYHFGGTYYERPASDFMFPRRDGSFGSQKEYFNEWVSSVKKLAALAQDRGAMLIIQTPTPEWKREKAKQCSNPDLQWFNSLQKETCNIESSFFNNKETGIYRHLFRQINQLSKSRKNIRLLDTYSIVCPEKTCNFNDGKVDIYRDDDHLSYQWAEDMLSPELSKLIKQRNQ